MHPITKVCVWSLKATVVVGGRKMGEWTEDARAASQALENDPDSPMAWHRLGCALAVSGQAGELLALADRAASRFGDSLIFFHNVVKDLATREYWDAVRSLTEAVPSARREHAIALYYSGCAQVVAGRHVEALKWFDRFKQSVLPRHRDFPLVDNLDFNLIFRQGMLIDSPEIVRQVRLQPPAVRPEIHFVGEPPSVSSPFVVAHVLDHYYFRRFAEELCAGHQAAGLAAPLHFHEVASQDPPLARLESLRRKFPALMIGFSHEAPGPWNHPVYYTCARFMVADKVMDYYGRPVMTVDADILPECPLDAIFAAAAGADFACFETGRNEPASVYQASIMWFGDTPRGRAFLSDLTSFCVAKLNLPPALSWMLDQAGLYSVLTQRGVDEPHFRFCALDKAMGLSLGQATRQLSSEGEKRAIMNAGLGPRGRQTSKESAKPRAAENNCPPARIIVPDTF